MTQIMINVGILLTQTLGYFRSDKWRMILGIGSILGGVQGAGLLFLKESETWKSPKQPRDAEQDALLLDPRQHVSKITRRTRS